MHILVTGGMGEIGRPTARPCLSTGTKCVLDLAIKNPSRVLSASRVMSRTSHRWHPPWRNRWRDHLAAVRHPGLAPEHTIFHINVAGTFNVFRAAADAGVRRVVCASSINALGYNFGIKFPEGQLRYFPIDEAHPTYTTDVYSFSKGMIEEVGAYFWRRKASAVPSCASLRSMTPRLRAPRS